MPGTKCTKKKNRQVNNQPVKIRILSFWEFLAEKNRFLGKECDYNIFEMLNYVAGSRKGYHCGCEFWIELMNQKMY